MELKKIWWAIRLQFLRPLFKKVGSKSYLGPSVCLLGHKNISIGNRVRIYPGNRMQTHDGGEIIIEDGCSIAQNCHITSGKTKLVIGKDTTISGNVFVTNIDHEYKDIKKHIMDQPFLYKETEIGEGCFIGYGAAIQAGTKLGQHCVVGTNAVVRGVFSDYSVIVGVPAKVVKRYNFDTQNWEKYDE